MLDIHDAMLVFHFLQPFIFLENRLKVVMNSALFLVAGEFPADSPATFIALAMIFPADFWARVCMSQVLLH